MKYEIKREQNRVDFTLKEGDKCFKVSDYITTSDALFHCHGKEYVAVPNSNGIDMYGVFDGRIKDAIEQVRHGLGDLIVGDYLNPSVVFFLDRKYGEEVKQRTIDKYKTCEFGYAIKGYFEKSRKYKVFDKSGYEIFDGLNIKRYGQIPIYSTKEEADDAIQKYYSNASHVKYTEYTRRTLAHAPMSDIAHHTIISALKIDSDPEDERVYSCKKDGHFIMEPIQYVSNQPLLYDCNYSDFDIEKHKARYIGYTEVLIKDDGSVVYATPSHQEAMIKIICENTNTTRDQLIAEWRSRIDVFTDPIDWLLDASGCVCIWYDRYKCKGINKNQVATMRKFKMEGIYKGPVPVDIFR